MGSSGLGHVRHTGTVRIPAGVKAMNLTQDLITITRPRIKDLSLDDDRVKEAAKEVWSLTRDGLKDNEFNALVSFVLTTPKGTLAKSTLLKLVNSGHLFQIDKHFLRFAPKSGPGSVSIPRLRQRQANLYKLSLATNKEVKHGSAI